MSGDRESCIEAVGLSKAYRIWKDPAARLKYPLLRAIGRALPPGLRPARWSPASEGRDHGYYRDFFALRDLTFSIGRGEIVGIMGRNGSGKSTLLQILAGTLRPSRGGFRVRGQVAALLELGSGFNPDFTGRENALLNAAILGLSRKEAEGKLDEILAFADIGDFVDQPTKTYSSGMMVRLAFAVQTAIVPEILIVDEALSVGDEAFQRKCFARIERLQERGTTILLVSHSSAQVVQLCDRAILLHEGELLLDDEPATVAKQYHRLIYSPPERHEAILERIRAGDLADEEEEGDGEEPGVTLDEGVQMLEGEEGDESFFDPSLVSQSRVEYPSEGIRLSDPTIYNARGEKVNVLSSGIKYRLCYSAVVEDHIFQVRFGTLLRNKAGIDLSGFRTRLGDSGCEHLEPGRAVEVEFRFRCLLAEGLYFLNAGAEGADGSGRVFLHRIVDSVCFRVLPEKNPQDAGITRLFDQVQLRFRE